MIECSEAREKRFACAGERCDCAFCCASVPEAMAARRVARLASRSERRVCAARRDLRAVFRARLVESREELAASADVRRDLVECCSWIREVIWEESFSRTERASWMQLSRLERRIRASKVEVSWGEWVVVLNGLEGVVRGSSRGRLVKLV